jgi:hypothetical protein
VRVYKVYAARTIRCACGGDERAVGLRVGGVREGEREMEECGALVMGDPQYYLY